MNAAKYAKEEGTIPSTTIMEVGSRGSVTSVMELAALGGWRVRVRLVGLVLNPRSARVRKRIDIFDKDGRVAIWRG